MQLIVNDLAIAKDGPIFELPSVSFHSKSVRHSGYRIRCQGDLYLSNTVKMEYLSRRLGSLFLLEAWEP